jgi:hypothetical protein
MQNTEITMTAGDDKSIVVYVTDPATGAAVDITSAAVSWKVTKSLRSTAVISKATSGSGIAITSGSGGIFTITLAPSNTSTLTPGDYYHEAQITFSGTGLVATVLKGIMTIEPGFV